MASRDNDVWYESVEIRRLRLENERLRQKLTGVTPRKGPAPRARVKPATLTWEEAAAFALRRNAGWLYRNIDALPGFPRPHAGHNRFLTEEVEDWVKRTFRNDPRG